MYPPDFFNRSSAKAGGVLWPFSWHPILVLTWNFPETCFRSHLQRTKKPRYSESPNFGSSFYLYAPQRRFLQALHGGFQSHGDTPRGGWFIKGNPHTWKWGMPPNCQLFNGEMGPALLQQAWILWQVSGGLISDLVQSAPKQWLIWWTSLQSLRVKIL